MTVLRGIPHQILIYPMVIYIIGPSERLLILLPRMTRACKLDPLYCKLIVSIFMLHIIFFIACTFSKRDLAIRA